MRRAVGYGLLASATIVTFVVFYFGLQAGLVPQLNSSEPDFCTMSYMWPLFRRVNMDDHSRFADKYGLFLYEEGSQHSRVVRTKLSQFQVTILSLEHVDLNAR